MMSVLNNFSISVARAVRKLHHKMELGERAPRPPSRASTRRTEDAAPAQRLRMDKCLLLSKVTRYEYEKSCNDNMSDAALEQLLRARGTDFDLVLHQHLEQKSFEEALAKSFRDAGINVEMANRLTYSQDMIDWSDVVVPVGGDGTFLLAASKVCSNTKPVIGFNSLPHKSVGRLCLPRWCSSDVPGALQALRDGKFKYLKRSRIRTTILCNPQLLDTITPVDVHAQNLSRYPAMPQLDPAPPQLFPEERSHHQPSNPATPLATVVLPNLALNEVFIGESVTSRVSLLRLQVDGGEWTQTKSSGLCVTTGTGSTSWHFSINCLRTQSVQDLLRILRAQYGVAVDCSVEKARQVTETYNQRIMFEPDRAELAYSVREYITFEEWPAPRGMRGRDRASCISVKSHCIDAGLVIDGRVSFPFNDGCEAVLEVHPEDALLTVQMSDAIE